VKENRNPLSATAPATNQSAGARRCNLSVAGGELVGRGQRFHVDENVAPDMRQRDNAAMNDVEI
jgi:hypothetical protein